MSRPAWMTWRRVGAAVVALAALLGGLLSRGPRWRGRARRVAQEGNQEAQEAVARRAQQEEARVDQELEEKRGLPGGERLAGVLRRARRRRAGGPPPAGS